MNKENCALKLVDEIILYYDTRSKKTSNSKIYLIIDFAGYFPTQNLHSPPNHVTAILRKKHSPVKIQAKAITAKLI